MIVDVVLRLPLGAAQLLAAIAGLEYDHNSVDGHSLVPAMKHSEDTKGYALSQYMRCADDGNWVCTQSLDSQITQMGYSIRVSGWRYTEWFNWNHPSSVADWEHPLAKELYLCGERKLEVRGRLTRVRVKCM